MPYRPPPYTRTVRSNDVRADAQNIAQGHPRSQRARVDGYEDETGAQKNSSTADATDDRNATIETLVSSIRHRDGEMEHIIAGIVDSGSDADISGGAGGASGSVPSGVGRKRKTPTSGETENEPRRRKTSSRRILERYLTLMEVLGMFFEEVRDRFEDLAEDAEGEAEELQGVVRELQRAYITKNDSHLRRVTRELKGEVQGRQKVAQMARNWMDNLEQNQPGFEDVLAVMIDE